MRLIDTHCHLCSGRLAKRMAAVLSRGRAAGVVGFICAAADLGESARALDAAGENGDVFCIAGIHPHDAKDAPDDYLSQIEQLATNPRNVAIGEIGLDYHYDLSPRPVQQRLFAEQLVLAGRLRKPFVVHTREAFDETLAILGESGADPASAVFHSFAEGPDGIRRVLDIGAMVSFSGILTFASATNLREAAKCVPPDRLLIETDAPYLSPEPVRKIKANEPAHVAHVATCLAEVRGTRPEAIAELTTQNAIRFFTMPMAPEGR